ncbi:hypothetical protein RvY_00398-2 [Ramazzottius varieornatus]|uniref:Uncharacterized protein n=2 Tax=Ramazzottius varieornatus TaxID=947166 RepID=A0A1D1UCM8_RAMVA|nr:hypothetical protein RvY_00398-2 [Ramazzottius varieornatus]
MQGKQSLDRKQTADRSRRCTYWQYGEAHREYRMGRTRQVESLQIFIDFRGMAQIYLKLVLLLCFVISTIIYLAHKIFHVTTETGESCISMFMGGFYAMDDFGQKGTWYAPCELIYRSTINESADCLRKSSVYLGKENHIVLIGDSRIRQLRDGLIYHLSGVEHDFYVNPAIAYDQQLYKKHESTVTSIPTANLLIEFFWSVEMDEEGGTFGHALRTLESKGSKPDMIIIGAGIWVMKVCTYQKISQVECLRNFKKNLIKPLQMLNRFADTGTVLWTPQNLVDEPRLLNLEYSHKLDIFRPASADL